MTVREKLALYGRAVPVDALKRNVIRDAETAGCFSHGNVHWPHTHSSAIRLIVRLLGARSPSAIFGCIWTIVVDAIDGVTWWTCAHVSQERREVVRPFFTHLYSSRAIGFVTRIARVRASLLSADPNVIFALVRAAVAQMAASAKASATVRLSARQNVAANGFLGAAITPTDPHRCLAFVGTAMRNKQSTEALAGEVFQLHKNTQLYRGESA